VEFLIVMALVLVVLYVVTIRPQRQRQLTQQRMIESADVGDDVLTSGGIYGTITQAEDDDIVVEIADGLNVHMTRRGIAAVLPPEEEEEEEAAAEDAEGDEEAAPEHEAAVTQEEEGVVREAETDPAASERR
jgi:preprotein translocase subunit YajC